MGWWTDLTELVGRPHWVGGQTILAWWTDRTGLVDRPHWVGGQTAHGWWTDHIGLDRPHRFGGFLIVFCETVERQNCKVTLHSVRERDGGTCTHHLTFVFFGIADGGTYLRILWDSGRGDLHTDTLPLYSLG